MRIAIHLNAQHQFMTKEVYYIIVHWFLAMKIIPIHLFPLKFLPKDNFGFGGIVPKLPCQLFKVWIIRYNLSFCICLCFFYTPLTSLKRGTYLMLLFNFFIINRNMKLNSIVWPRILFRINCHPHKCLIFVL